MRSVAPGGQRAYKRTNLEEEAVVFNAITHSSIFVLDQDEALDFYVGKLGLEVAVDADLGFMRWLTIRVPGEVGREILLETPSPQWTDEGTAEQIRRLVTKGALGLAFILTTDDCQKTYDELRSRGVEFTQEPTQMSYGIDCALSDPSGNQIRIAQTAPVTT